MGETIANHLASRLADEPARADAMRKLGQQTDGLSRFVRARLLALRGDAAAAVEALGEAARTPLALDPELLLHRARLLVRQERFAEATDDLQAALSRFPPYSFFVKSEKVFERVLASGQWRPRRTARLAVLSSSTTSLLAPVLRAAGFRRGLQLEIYEGAYGNYQQEVLDPNSGLYEFYPDLVVILVNHRDLALPPAGGEEQVRDFGIRLRNLWTTLLARNPCHVIQVGVDAPPAGAWGSLEAVLPDGRRRLLVSLNLALADDRPQGVSFLDANALATQVEPSYWAPAEWYMAKQYPASAALPLLADAIGRIAPPRSDWRRKCWPSISTIRSGAESSARTYWAAFASARPAPKAKAISTCNDT